MPASYTADFSAFSDLLEGAEQNVKFALEAGLNRMANQARNLAPVGETGHLKGSIRGGQIEGSFAGGTIHGDLSATAPGAEAQEFGSGIHGERGAPIEIRPRFKRALRFPIAGSVAAGSDGYGFAKLVRHPGVRARRFLQQGVESDLDTLSAEIAEAITSGKR